MRKQKVDNGVIGTRPCRRVIDDKKCTGTIEIKEGNSHLDFVGQCRMCGGWSDFASVEEVRNEDRI